MKYTNNKNISLPMAVWLAHDDYEYSTKQKTISVTTLLKPTRQLIIQSRMTEAEATVDISLLLASQIGTAIHAAIEKAWLYNYKESMEALGYPKKVIEAIKVNSSTINPDAINIITEKRVERPIDNWIITGCPDLICDGSVHDIKGTKVNTYIKKTKEHDHKLQLSIYKWQQPDVIIEPTGYIEYVFTDWSLIKSYHTKDYPQLPVLQHKIHLLDNNKTEQFIRDKLNELEKYADTPEPNLPLCNDRELWRDPPTYQYFSSPTNNRASKNFKTMTEANSWAMQKGKGVVKQKPSKALACLWCSAAPKCSQFKQLLSQNLIVTRE